MHAQRDTEQPEQIAPRSQGYAQASGRERRCFPSTAVAEANAGGKILTGCSSCSAKTMPRSAANAPGGHMLSTPHPPHPARHRLRHEGAVAFRNQRS